MAKRNANAIDVLESAYNLEGSLQSWAVRCQTTATEALGQGKSALVSAFELRPGEKMQYLALAGDPDVVEFFQRCSEHAAPEDEQRIFAAHKTAIVQSAIAGLDSLDFVADRGPPGPLSAVLGNIIREGPLGLQLLTVHGDDTIGPGLFNHHEKLSIHLASGFRLHQTIGNHTTAAVLDPSGRCLHAEGLARSKDAREKLRAAAIAIDRARGRLRREDPQEALEIWNGLVRGEWTLLDRFESDGKRFCIAVRNPPNVARFRMLSLRERQVAHYAAMGYANKMIGYSLGLATSTVATHIRAAMRKLGVGDRIGLVQLLASMEAAGGAATHASPVDPSPPTNT